MLTLLIPSWRLFSKSDFHSNIFFVCKNKRVCIADLLKDDRRNLKNLFLNPKHNLTLYLHSQCEKYLADWESQRTQTENKIMRLFQRFDIFCEFEAVEIECAYFLGKHKRKGIFKVPLAKRTDS